VVGREHREGIVGGVVFVQGLEKTVEFIVERGDHPVELPTMLPNLVGDPLRDVRREVRVGIGPLGVPCGGLERRMRRSPREEHEKAVLAVAIDELTGDVGLDGRLVLVVSESVGFDVAPELWMAAVVVVAAVEPAPEVVPSSACRRHEAGIGGLEVDRRIVARPAVEMPLSDVPRAVAGVAEALPERRLVVAEWHPVPDRTAYMGVTAGLDTAAGRRTDRVVGEGILAQDAVVGETVDRRCVDPFLP
jgi:hypothetical protein